VLIVANSNHLSLKFN